VCAKLGYSRGHEPFHKKCAAGLILMPLEDGRFKRVSMFLMPPEDETLEFIGVLERKYGSETWDGVERREITIICTLS
jgi:hypothetical protein